jgi:hypothetical protein
MVLDQQCVALAIFVRKIPLLPLTLMFIETFFLLVLMLMLMLEGMQTQCGRMRPACDWHAAARRLQDSSLPPVRSPQSIRHIEQPTADVFGVVAVAAVGVASVPCALGSFRSQRIQAITFDARIGPPRALSLELRDDVRLPQRFELGERVLAQQGERTETFRQVGRDTNSQSAACDTWHARRAASRLSKA